MQSLFWVTLSLMLAACSGTPPPQFYTLDAQLQPSIANISAGQKLRVIGVGPIALPALLNRKAIVTRGAQQSIQVSETQQWAEPLLDNITRVVAHNLAILHPQYMLHSYPWTAFGTVDTRIVMEITRFDAEMGKSVYFDAVWSIKDEQQDKVLKQGHSQWQKTLHTQDTAEMVMQMNAILAAFSQELSQALD